MLCAPSGAVEVKIQTIYKLFSDLASEHVLRYGGFIQEVQRMYRVSTLAKDLNFFFSHYVSWCLKTTSNSLVDSLEQLCAKVREIKKNKHQRTKLVVIHSIKILPKL